MAEFDVGLRFTDGNMPEQLARAYQEADKLDRKLDELQTTINQGVAQNKAGQALEQTATAAAKSTAALQDFEKVADTAFQTKDVKAMAAELAKLSKTIDGAGGVADAVESLGTEYLKLKKSADILKSALKTATDPALIKTYASSIATLEKGMDELKNTAKQAGVNLKNVEKNANTGTQVFDNFFGQFTKAGLIIAAIEAVIQFTAYAVGLSVAVDKSNKALEAYFQDASKAADVTNQLIALSQEKLLPLDDTLAAGKALAGYGIEADRIAFTLGNIAEISAATGKDLNELSAIYGKARTSGVLYAEDINQLLDAGVNIIPQFAKQLGISADEVKKFASEGKIRFEELQLAFANLAGEGGIYSGQIQKQSETLGGAFSALTARFQPLSKAIGDFFSDAAKGLISLTNTVIDKSVQAYNYVRNLFKSEQEIAEQRELANREEDEKSRAQYEKDLAFRDKIEKEAIDARNKKTAEQREKERAAAEKAAKEANERDKKRTALRIALIQDETEQLIAQAEQRGKEEEAQIRELFTKKGKLTAEGEDLLLKSREKTAKEVEKIQSDQFTKEQQLLADRLANEKKFTESYLAEQQRRAQSQKQIQDTQLETAEQNVDAYLLRLKAQGATEDEIKALREQFDLEIQKKRLLNELQFQQAILAATDAGDTERRKQIEAQIQLLQAQISNVQFQIDNPEPIKADKLKAAIEKIKNDIAKALGIPPDKLGGVVQSAVDSYEQIFSSIRAITDAQIEQNDRLLDSVNKKVTEQEKALEKEKQLAEDGKANNLKTEQDKLNALLKQQEDYEKKGQELREKAARQQLIQDTISQVSNTVSAVAKIYNANASIPVVGLILAAAQVASLFAGIAAARAKAKAAATERLFTGGEIPWGKTDEGGREGYRIEGTNLMVGGGEMVVNRKVTQANRDFLHKFNKGVYKGLDMEAVIADFHNRQNERAAFINNAAAGIDMLTTARANDGIQAIVDTIQAGNNQLIRNGFRPLHLLGQTYVDGDGNEVHISTDARSNIKRSKKRKNGFA